MAKKHVSKGAVSKLESQKQQQRRLIQKLRQTNRWLLWAVAIAIFLLLLLGLITGYASNWWQNPEASDRTSQFDADDGAGGASSNGQNNGSRTSTNTSGEESSSTTETNTTTNNSTTTNNTDSTSTDDSKSLLEIFLEEIAVGDNIDDVTTRANELGIGVECHNTLLAIQECEFTSGGNTVTTRNLITSNSITAILDNL
jgi:hypothetical protein